MPGSDVKLTKKDLNAGVWRSILLQGTFNYEKYQGLGWCAMMAPALKKIYGNDKEQLREALRDNASFINTQPVLSTFLQGLTLSMYEAKAERELVNSVRVSLFGPLAGIGDSVFWFTLLPIMAGLCSSIAAEGSLLGPFIFFAVYLAVFFSRFLFIRLGYQTGAKAVSQIGSRTKDLSTAASILGNTVIGGLIASYISISLKLEIPISDGVALSVQEAFFDKIIPNFLPVVITALMYYLLKKKKASPTLLIFGILATSVVLSFFGIV